MPGALASRRRRRGRDRAQASWSQRAPRPPPRRAAIGKPEGQRPLRAASRCFPAARGEAERGGSQDAGLGELGGPHWLPVASEPRTRVETRRCPWLRAHKGPGVGGSAASGIWGEGLSITSSRSKSPVSQLGTAIALVVSPLESYSGTFIPVPSKKEPERDRAVCPRRGVPGDPVQWAEPGGAQRRAPPGDT